MKRKHPKMRRRESPSLLPAAAVLVTVAMPALSGRDRRRQTGCVAAIFKRPSRDVALNRRETLVPQRVVGAAAASHDRRRAAQAEPGDGPGCSQRLPTSRLPPSRPPGAFVPTEDDVLPMKNKAKQNYRKTADLAC